MEVLMPTERKDSRESMEHVLAGLQAVGVGGQQMDETKERCEP